MSFIIRRIDQGGGYVAEPGSEKSYTHSLKAARKWPTREAAEPEACSNERVVRLADLIGEPRW